MPDSPSELRHRAGDFYRRRPGLALFLLFVATSFASRGFLIGVDILDVDEAMHIVGAWELLRGKHLYVGFVDNKPPLLYLYYAFAQLLLGRGMFAIHLFSVALTIPLTALGVSAFFAHDRKGALAGLAFLVFGAAYLAHDMHSVNCEMLMLLPATWAVAVLADEARAQKLARLFCSGTLLGIAMLFKQQAFAWFPALGLAAVLANRQSLRTLSLAATALVTGLALPLVATWAVFAALGDAQAFLYWTVFYNFGYAQQPMELGEILHRIAKYFLPFLAATVGLWVLALRSGKHFGRYQWALVASVLVCTLPIVFVGFRMYPHYFVPLYTPLALGAGPVLAALWTSPASRWAKLTLAYTLALWFCFSVANGILYLSGHEFPWEEHNPAYRQVAEVLHADACHEGASMFSWGPGAMFVYPADLPLASRFVGPSSTICGYVPGNWAIRSGRVKASDVIRPEHWEQLMGDLERSRATYILDGSHTFRNWKAFPVENFPRMMDYLQANYDVVNTVGTVRIFRRRGCAAGVANAQ
jgi:4-amino-4-deoxy-L-arabinose transferase-like glycosyltransferase